MSLELDSQREPQALAGRLAGLYGRWWFRYLVLMIVLSWLGFEASYGNPTPFYAVFKPALKAFLTGFTMLGVFSLVVLLVVFWQYGRGSRLRAFGLPALWFAYMALVVAPVAWATFSPRLQWRIAPSTVWLELQFHLLALGVFLAFVGGAYAALRRLDWFDKEPDARATTWFLVGLVFFGIVFSCAIAMLREGTAGIADAYSRYQYEYIGDIGFGRTLRGLFAEYSSKHEFLSIHAKVHPPGPIVLLWILSFVAGREALGLSLATIAVGSLAVVPLYYWVADLLDRRAALTACMLYTVMPSIVLFTATSADILFMPFTILTLLLFGRAIDRPSFGYAVAAGASYAVASLLSFSLLTLGAYFAFMGLLRMRNRERRFAVVRTAVVMLLAFLAIHLALRLWSGFDVVEVFRLSKAQFDLDQHNLEKLLPRYPSWSWKILNPLAWVYFAGIPVSVLFFWRLAKPEAGTKALFIVFALTLAVLDLAYLARGEGERSAMYILPFVVAPAAHAVDRLGHAAGRLAPLVVTLCALAFQCWFTEVLFYTYW